MYKMDEVLKLYTAYTINRRFSLNRIFMLTGAAMKTVELEHVLAQQDVASIISRFAAASDSPFAVKDENFTLLLGRETDDQPETYPVECNGSVMGWVSGKQEASLLASFISFAATHEYEKRLLEQTGSPQRGAAASMEQIEDYRLILEQAADVIYSVDRDFRIEYVSSSVKNHLGYVPEELTGRPFTELGLLTEESLNRAISNTIGIFKGEAVPTAEYELVTRDGRIRVAEIRSTPIYKNDAVVSIVSVARDITAQRKTEQALAASESRFRTMAENITSGIVIMEEGKIIYANNYACQLCGYTREEMISIWGPDLTAAQSGDQRDQILKSIHETGLYPEQVDIWINRKDGTPCCLNLRFSFSYSDTRKQTGYVLISDITERKLIEDRINATKSFLDKIIDNSIDAIVMADPRGFFKRVNKSFLTLTGYTEEEVLGKRIADFSAVMGETYDLTTGEHMKMSQEYMDYTLRMAEQLMDQKKIANWESYLVRKDGTAVPVETNITYLFNEQGVDTAVGIIRDITDRKKAEQELTATRDFLENIIESSLDPIIIGDKLGNITRVNSAFAQLVGFTSEELLGKHLAELVPPQAGLYDSTDGITYRVEESFYDRAYEQMFTLIESGHISAWDSYCFNKNGKIIPVEQTMFYSYDKQGNRQAVISINRDISERKKAEKTIIDTKNFLGDIIRTSADGIVVTDTVGTITLVNEAVERILGYSKEELLGKNTHDFMVVPDGEMRDDFVDTSSTAMDSVYYYESKWKGKNDRLVDLGMSVSTLQDYSGNTTGMVACVRDITDRKAAEQKLFEYQNQLRCLASQLTLTEEQERRRIATEIHDRIAQSLALAKIKLGSLGAAVQSVEKAKDVAAIRSLLEQCIKDTRSLIFDLSPPFLYEFGLEKALEWLLEDIQKQHGIRVHLEYSGSQGGYDDDVRVLLYQSIRELLINVVKHAHAKTATVSLDRNARKVHVCVEDDGQGFLISPDGFQVGSGGGYGIFSIKERFQHLGGALTVDSRLRHGTRISLDLPLVQHGA